MKRTIIGIIIFSFLAVFLYPFGDQKDIVYIDRATALQKTEKVAGEYALRWLYNNPFGKLSLQTLVKKKFFSDWYGKRMDSPASVDKIEDFISDFDIDMSAVEKTEFTSFNDFFIRKLKDSALHFCKDTNALASPSEGKILAYENIGNDDFIIKGVRFNLQSFLNDSLLKAKYKEASFLVIRLCPADYHRFYFPLDGIVLQQKNINGDLYSVSPIALRERAQLFCENKRTLTEIRNPKIGDFLMIEVGATMVGSIIQSYKTDTVHKGMEKGYFKFGGSTIVLVFQKKQIKIDKDLLQNTAKFLETKIKLGEAIAHF